MGAPLERRARGNCPRCPSSLLRPCAQVTRKSAERWVERTIVMTLKRADVWRERSVTSLSTILGSHYTASPKSFTFQMHWCEVFCGFAAKPFLLLRNHCCMTISTPRCQKRMKIRINQKWPASQRPRATFLIVLPQRAASHTWTHTSITQSLPHAHTIDQLRLLQISHTRVITTKFASRLFLCMLLSRTSDFEGEPLVQKCFVLCTNIYSIYFGAAWNRLDTFGAYDQSYTFGQPVAQKARWSFIV